MSDMPEFLRSIVSMINCLPCPDDEWKRLRIEMTADELEQYRQWVKADNPDNRTFVYAIRGVPIHLSEHPKDPPICLVPI